MSLDQHEAIVGLVDLLGYSADLMSVEFDASHLAGRKLKLLALRELIADFAHERCSVDADIHWTSDTCIVYRHFNITQDVQKTEEEVAESLRQVATVLGILQCTFAPEKYFSRGGIALGALVGEKGEEPSGPGLVRAAEIEKKIIVDPKIGVSGRLAGPAINLKVPNSERDMFRLDFPLPSIDYLAFAEVCSDFGDPRSHLAWHADAVHTFVEYAYRNPVVATKAAWLLDYHNWHIRSRGTYEDLIVPLASPFESKKDSNNETTQQGNPADC